MQRRNTRQRDLVLQAVMSLHDHPTADDIYTFVRTQDSHISRGTVYRNLNLLAEEGAIIDVKIPGGSRFDYRTDDHAHLYCSECGRVLDVPNPFTTEEARKLEAVSGYAHITHYTMFSGICPECQKALEEAGEDIAELASAEDLIA